MYALVDCNNFFVSCERVFRPELEGRPVVVLSNNDGCVVSRSNEAKKMGIKMGTPFFRLKQFVDAGALVAASSNYVLYRDLSMRVMSVLADAFPKIEIYSVDEAYLVLDGFSPEQFIPMCRELRARVRKWVGIPVSIGIAPTKTLAKMASHFAKKYAGYKGVCVIDSDEKRVKALQLTPVSDVWGIGRRFAAKLDTYMVKTAFDFVDRPQDWVSRHFNLPGVRVWQELQGIDCVAEENADYRQSICTSRSFADMTESVEELTRAVSDFAAECARQLRRDMSAAQRVTTFLYTNRFREDLDQYYPSATIYLETAVNDTQSIVAAALRALSAIWRPGFLYKKAGVIVSDVCPSGNVQKSLFDNDEAERARRSKISSLMDSIGELRLAVQNSDSFKFFIRSEHRSKHFTTSLDDIIEVH